MKILLIKKAWKVLIVSSLLAVGCRSAKSPLGDFSNMKDHPLSGEEIKLDSDTILYRPYSFQVYDTLGVFNDNTGEAGFTVVNFKTGKLIRKFAFAGDQPSQFDLNAISMNSAIDNKSAFTVLQANPPCKILLYNWDSLLHNNLYTPRLIFRPQKFIYSASYLLNDSIILGQFSTSKFDGKMYGITDLSSGKLITGLDFPQTNNKSLAFYYNSPTYYFFLKHYSDGALRYRPGSKYEFAFFSRVGAVLQLFDVSTDYKFMLKCEKIYYLPSFTLIKDRGTTSPIALHDNKYGFSDVTVTKNKIYALYSGQLSSTRDMSANVVLVYNWAGVPVEKFTLDKKCLRIFIDNTHPETLYGLWGPMGNRVIKYRLP